MNRLEARAASVASAREIGTLNLLDPKKQAILERRFPHEGETETLAEIGQDLNISREGVRQIELSGLKAIDKHERNLGISPKPNLPEQVLEHLENIYFKHERERQTTKLVDLGFHRELGASAHWYPFSFPDIARNHLNLKNMRPLIVETRIPIPKQLENAGIKNVFREQIEWPNLPENPYTLWFRAHPYKTPWKKGLGDGRNASESRTKCDKYSRFIRGGTINETIAACIQYPELVPLEAIGEVLEDQNGNSYLACISKDKKGAIIFNFRQSDRILRLPKELEWTSPMIIATEPQKI